MVKLSCAYQYIVAQRKTGYKTENRHFVANEENIYANNQKFIKRPFLRLPKKPIHEERTGRGCGNGFEHLAAR